jgi:hypothetical protein
MEQSVADTNFWIPKILVEFGIDKRVTSCYLTHLRYFAGYTATHSVSGLCGVEWYRNLRIMDWKEFEMNLLVYLPGGTEEINNK